MKTSDTIEEQDERKAARGDGGKPRFSPANTPPAREKLKQRDASRIAAWRWQKGGPSPNPTGRPKHDLAAELARGVFEENMDALHKAFSKALLRGNAYAYKELADRGYGKIKETIQVDSNPLREYSEAELWQRSADLKRQIAEYEEKLTPPPAWGEPIKPN